MTKIWSTYFMTILAIAAAGCSTRLREPASGQSPPWVPVREATATVQLKRPIAFLPASSFSGHPPPASEFHYMTYSFDWDINSDPDCKMLADRPNLMGNADILSEPDKFLDFFDQNQNMLAGRPMIFKIQEISTPGHYAAEKTGSDIDIIRDVFPRRAYYAGSAMLKMEFTSPHGFVFSGSADLPTGEKGSKTGPKDFKVAAAQVNRCAKKFFHYYFDIIDFSGDEGLRDVFQ